MHRRECDTHNEHVNHKLPHVGQERQLLQATRLAVLKSRGFHVLSHDCKEAREGKIDPSCAADAPDEIKPEFRDQHVDAGQQSQSDILVG